MLRLLYMFWALPINKVSFCLKRFTPHTVQSAVFLFIDISFLYAPLPNFLRSMNMLFILSAPWKKNKKSLKLFYLLMNCQQANNIRLTRSMFSQVC